MENQISLRVMVHDDPKSWRMPRAAALNLRDDRGNPLGQYQYEQDDEGVWRHVGNEDAKPDAAVQAALDKAVEQVRIEKIAAMGRSIGHAPMT